MYCGLTFIFFVSVFSSPVYNVADEDDDDEEEENQVKEKNEENNKMKEKMDQLRTNMEKMSITKKVGFSREIIIFYRRFEHGVQQIMDEFHFPMG